MVVAARPPPRWCAAGVRVATCWDLAAVHRLLARRLARRPGAGLGRRPRPRPRHDPGVRRQPDLFDPGPDPAELDEPVGADGHLRPEWVAGAWAATPARLARWAELAVDVADPPARSVLDRRSAPQAPATARAESTAELLCAELAADGLPVDRPEAERIIAAIVGPRPRTAAEADAQRAARDAEVLRHAPPGGPVDLRSPAQVRSLLRRVGVEVPDTRAWRLEALRDAHPLVDALLTWRKAERVATTYGYGWLDEHVGADGRLRGQWTGSDGAAGRMTATAGLHNMPADLRPAVVAEPGHVFVRADLGQIEPRVLAAVSGDARLAEATHADDLYAPVAEQLGVDRATAKVAVLGAMYGQTTGHGAQALRRLEAAYPVAMGYLHDADVAGQVGRDVRTVGGRLVRMGTTNANEVTERDARRRAAARGRYARNAMVQGAAAELFKLWAVTVRARPAPRRRPHRAVPARRAARPRPERAAPTRRPRRRRLPPGGRRRGGRRAPPCASSPTSAPSGAGPTPSCVRRATTRLRSTRGPAVICDPHHHLWEHPEKPYMMAQLRADTGSVDGVVTTVFVECGSGYRTDGPEAFRPVGETEFVVAADPDGFIAGIVGFADLTAPEVADVLAAHVEAGQGRFRGIRHVNACDPSPDIRESHTKPPPGLLGHGRLPARRSPPSGAAGLSFDAWMYHPQLPELVGLRRAHPDVPVVARPPRRTARHRAVRRPPRRGARRLAGVDGRRRRVRQRRAQARRHRHGRVRAWAGTSAPAGRRPSSSPRRGASRSAGASRRSASSAACSSRTSRSTRCRAATPTLWAAFELIAAGASDSRRAALFARHGAARTYRI